MISFAKYATFYKNGNTYFGIWEHRTHLVKNLMLSSTYFFNGPLTVFMKHPVGKFDTMLGSIHDSVGD